MKLLCRILALLPVALVLSQCASIRPQGDNPAEQRAFIDAETDRILANLAKQTPDSRDEIAAAEGYAAFRYTSGKLPIIIGGLGAGAGYGATVDNSNKARSYMKVQKVNWGWGMGVKGNSVVFIFSDRQVLEKFRSGKWDGGPAAEATAKKDDIGAGVGGVATPKKGYKAYTLTDAGLSYGITYQARRFSPISSLNR